MRSVEEGAESVQSFAYEVKENSVVIHRCFSRDTKVVIPERLAGFPVTELAPYAFSAHIDEAQFQRERSAGKIKVSRSAFQTGEELEAEVPALCGEHLEELNLPASVTRVGRYCFYNCGNLHRLSFTGKLTDWGTGVFTGCHQIKELCVIVDESGKTALKDVLDEVREELCVEYRIEESEKQSGLQAPKRARLMIPEYYEEGVENTPARILETHIHGSGMKYRNCFVNRQIDIHQYDTLFSYAQALETPEFTMQMAMGRLQYPYELSARAREQYVQYVREHVREFARYLTDTQDMDGIRWMMGQLEKEEQNVFLAELIEQAGRKSYAEALGYAMELQHESQAKEPAKRRRRLEL